MPVRREVPDELLASASEAISQALALHYPEARWDDLERGLTSACRSFGLRSATDLARLLSSRPPTSSEIDGLAVQLTIGETYFFREEEFLCCLGESIFPELLAAHGSIRIWSAGCATGEEPYSLAIMLDRLAPGSDATILATDINPVSLAKARAGTYGAWSFRTTSPALRDRYFRETRPGRWTIDPNIRRRVTFRALNLAAPIDDVAPMHLILCRNVLMYFSPQRQADVVAAFRRSLVPGGWLLAGASEMSISAFSIFENVQRSGCTLYRNSGEIRGSVPVIPIAPMNPPRPPRVEIPVVVSPEEIEQSLRISDAVEDKLENARRLADQRRLGEAELSCRQALEAHRTHAISHYLLGVIQNEKGEDGEALESLRRAVYLDPDFVVAHFALANLASSRGRRADAERHLRNAMTALHGYPDEAVVPESGGLIVRRMVAIVRSAMATLQERSAWP